MGQGGDLEDEPGLGGKRFTAGCALETSVGSPSVQRGSARCGSHAASGCGNAGLFANALFGKTYLWICTFPARSAQELSASHAGVRGNAWHSSSQVLGEV